MQWPCSRAGEEGWNFTATRIGYIMTFKFGFVVYEHIVIVVQYFDEEKSLLVLGVHAP